MSTDKAPTSTIPYTAPPTPLSWRLFLAIAVVVLALIAYFTRETIGPRGQAGFGVVCFFLFQTQHLSANQQHGHYKGPGFVAGFGEQLMEIFPLDFCRCPGDFSGVHLGNSAAPPANRSR